MFRGNTTAVILKFNGQFIPPHGRGTVSIVIVKRRGADLNRPTGLQSMERIQK